jgi:ERCC4-type nuclease
MSTGLDGLETGVLDDSDDCLDELLAAASEDFSATVDSLTPVSLERRKSRKPRRSNIQKPRRSNIQKPKHSDVPPIHSGTDLKKSSPKKVSMKISGQPKISKLGYYIVVDFRERKVIPHFKSCSVPYELDNLGRGDYAIMFMDEVKIVIERKTWSDLAATIKDSDRRKNKQNLLDIREDTGCTLFYLIEGSPFINNNSKKGGIRGKSLKAHLDHLMIRDRISVIYTKNPAGTVERVVDLVKNIQTLREHVVAAREAKKRKSVLSESKNISGGNKNSDIKTISGTARIKQRKKKCDLDILYKLWSCVTHVGPKVASVFVDNKIKLRDFLLGNITETQLRVLRFNSGVLVGDKAKKIIRAQNPKYVNTGRIYIRLISSLPGFSVTSAELLLEKFSMRKILTMEDCPGIRTELKNTKRSKSRTFGTAMIDLIFKFQKF